MDILVNDKAFKVLKTFTSKNRAVDSETGYCEYQTKEGKCCSVGLLLKDSAKKTWTEYDTSVQEIHRFLHPVDFKDSFLKEYQGVSLEVLHSMQTIHDEDENFDENGFTERGKKCYENERDMLINRGLLSST